jgi:hypothetical protein
MVDSCVVEETGRPARLAEFKAGASHGVLPQPLRVTSTAVAANETVPPFGSMCRQPDPISYQQLSFDMADRPWTTNRANEEREIVINDKMMMMMAMATVRHQQSSLEWEISVSIIARRSHIEGALKMTPNLYGIQN